MYSSKGWFEIRGVEGEGILIDSMPVGPNRMFTIDYNRDEVDEIAVYNLESSTLYLLDQKGRTLSTKNLNYSRDSNIKEVSTADFGDKRLSYISIEGMIQWIDWSPNPFHFLKWLIVICLFFVFWGFTEIVLWTQRNQIREKQELEIKVKKLQAQSVKNQLDPHFTFNALNVLGYLAKQDDREGLDSFVNHFSKLLRRQVEISDKSYTTLYDELRFVDHYVELQKLRFDQPIQYDLDVQGEIDMNLRIPKMMIHTHIENAIKHGLIPAGGGHIWVRITSPNSHTLIEIENNGASRSQSSGEKNGSTGKGLAILDQLYDLFYQLYKIQIKQEIVDQIDANGNPSGVKVIIKL